MTTLARTRAETLFASITASADRAIEPILLPKKNTVELRQAGPNTLHLPSAAHPALAGWAVKRSRRMPKATAASTSW